MYRVYDMINISFIIILFVKYPSVSSLSFLRSLLLITIFNKKNFVLLYVREKEKKNKVSSDDFDFEGMFAI